MTKSAPQQDVGVLYAELEAQNDELEQSQARLVEVAERYRRLFQDQPTPLAHLTRGHVVTELNAAAIELLKTSPTRHGPFEHFVEPGSMARWHELVREGRDGSATRDLELRTTNGLRVPCRVTLTMLDAFEVLLCIENQSGLRSAETARQRASARYEKLLASSKQGVVAYNAATGVIVEINAEAARDVGATTGQLIGAHVSALFAPQQRPTIELALRKAAADPAAAEHPLEIALAGELESVVEAVVGRFDEEGGEMISLVWRDISERARLARDRVALAEAMLQSQKMEAVGRLAAGVAHDMNNILAIILGSVSAAEPTSPEDVAAAFDEIRTAAVRGRELSNRLRTLYQHHPQRTEIIDLNAMLDELARLARRTISSTIRIELSLSPEPVYIEGDGGAWSQALLNLAINARDAMPDGGILWLESRIVNGACELTVRDSGCGMTEEVRARAFEPFFTTKSQGEGSGLGLAHVHSVARQHGAEIRLDSEPWAGTSFTFRIPLAAKPARAAAAKAPAAKLSYRGTILLVDDEPGMRRSLSRLLQRVGATVTVADGGHEAAARLREQRFDLVLTDLAMPGADGEWLARHIQAAHYEVPVIVMTGDLSDSKRVKLQEAGVHGVVHKPFTQTELIETIRAAHP